jgi:hypothetical protein
MLRSWLLGAAGVLAVAVPGAPAGETPRALQQYLKVRCDFAANPWCKLPGDPRASYITNADAMRIARNDEAARDRLWGWGGPGETFGAWGSAATDGRRMYFFGGGHHHYRGNDLKVYDFETLEWSRLYDPSYVTTKTHRAGKRRYIPAKGPRAVHVYDGMVYAEADNSLYLWGHNSLHAWRFDLDAFEETRDPWQAWREFSMPQGRTQLPLAFFRTAVMPGGDILVHGSPYSKGRGEMFRFDPDNGSYAHVGGPQFAVGNLVSADDKVYGRSANGTRLDVYDARGRRMGSIDKPEGFSGVGMAHDSRRNLLVLWNGQADTLVYDRRAETWHQIGTLADAAPQGAPRGPYGRFQYLESAGVFVGLAKDRNGDRRMWAYRVPDPIPTEHPLRAKRESAGYVCSDEIAGWQCPDLGDQIARGEVKRGIYHQCATVSRRVDFNGAWLKERACGDKAALIARDGAVIENVTITDISIGSNANCVRWEGGAVTLRNVTCKRADMGLLGFGKQLKIVDSTFAQTLDRGSNHGHVLYTCVGNAKVGTLVIRNSTLASPGDEGHVLKTGCATTRIEASTITGGDGNYSRVIDAFNGGRLIVRDSTLAVGTSGGNGDLIGYGAEQRTALPEHVVDLRGGTTDCTALSGWGNTLHIFRNLQPASVAWTPAQNRDCAIPDG